jgi:broad specificity phosphatase PhoE
MIEVAFETHSISEDNANGIASGWAPSRLSARGRALARQLGERRRHDRILGRDPSSDNRSHRHAFGSRSLFSYFALKK